MTSTVKVTAHCSPNKEVAIFTIGSGTPVGGEFIILQDGESHETYAYDDKCILVRERFRININDEQPTNNEPGDTGC